MIKAKIFHGLKSLLGLFNYQFVRFVIVGMLNTGFSYLIYAIGLMFGLNYAIANLIALLLGILFSFRTQGQFVFNNTDINLLGRFILGWSAIYLVAIASIGALSSIGIDNYTAGALTLPITTGLSYILQKKFVFHIRTN